ncbi:high mobility group nucleosome-binding domain-containing protein 3 isoform 3-T3 [Synchiropus picturatus]
MLFWSSFPLCLCAHSVLVFCVCVLNNIYYITQIPREPSLHSLVCLRFPSQSRAWNQCAQRARHQSAFRSNKSLTNHHTAFIHNDTRLANQGTGQERDLSPPANGCGSHRLSGSAYNQHIIEGALDIDPEFEAVQIPIYLTCNLDLHFYAPAVQQSNMPKRKSPEGAEGKEASKVTKHERPAPPKPEVKPKKAVVKKSGDDKGSKTKKGSVKGKKEDAAQNGDTKTNEIFVSRPSVMVSSIRNSAPSLMSVRGQTETVKVKGNRGSRGGD